MVNLPQHPVKITQGPFKGFYVTLLAWDGENFHGEVELFGRKAPVALSFDAVDLPSETHRALLAAAEARAAERYRPSPLLQQLTPADQVRFQPIRRRLQEIYGFDFPDSFFLFWQFCQTLPENALAGSGSPLDMSLGDVFDIFKTEDLAHFDPRESARSYNDPPEFFTVLHGHTDGLHWGYWLDDPDHAPQNIWVTSYYANDAFNISLCGYTLFEALRHELELHYAGALENLSDDPDEEAFYRKQLRQLDQIRALLITYCTADRPETGWDYDDNDNYAVKRAYVADTRDGMGIVLPPALYHPLPFRDLFTDTHDGWNYEPTVEEVATLKEHALALLEQGLPGAAFKLGKDLWIYPRFYKTSYQLLDKAYAALNRPTLQKMLTFRKEKLADSLPQFQAALKQPETTLALYMGRANLGTLPSTIGQLTHLEHLDLGQNNLEQLPAEFGALTALQTLNLADNLFETFPTVLCHLSQLQELNLSGNFLQHLPEEIQQMAGLECLRLSNNRFTEFPLPLCALPHLRQLYLWGSHIDQIPDAIGRLTALEEWHLKSDHPLGYVSPQVQQLVNLRCLRYDYSQAGTANDEKFMFPVTLCRIPNLRKLTIGTNKVLIIPDEIQQLQQLEELIIDNYQLETLNPAIFRLSRLKTLRLPSGRLESIPAEIEQLQTLEELSWVNSLTQPPEVLTRLPHLKKLEVSRYRLDEGVKAWLREHVPDIISI